MIEIKTIGVWGFEGALTGMRLPYESGAKSDSAVEDRNYESRICRDCRYGDYDEHRCNMPYFDDEVEQYGVQYIIGNNDMKLCKKLIEAGSEHRKFLRMIHVQFNIRMPRYFATQLDTYKVGTVKNSSSTMHLITKRLLTDDDFSFDYGDNKLPDEYMRRAIDNLNDAIREYQKDKEEKSDKYTLDRDFRTIKQILPEGFMQKATYDMTYETLLNIYRQRRSHRLKEWAAFCDWAYKLPYFKEFVE